MIKIKEGCVSALRNKIRKGEVSILLHERDIGVFEGWQKRCRSVFQGTIVKNSLHTEFSRSRIYSLCKVQSNKLITNE